MILKFLFCILTILIANTNAQLPTRVSPKLACDCKFGEYAREEMQLGQEYLDISFHVASDRVALYGFEKLFKHYWSIQLDNMHKVLKYSIKRGDRPTLFKTRPLKIRSSLNETGPLHQVKVMIDEFIRNERRLNANLLRLSKCSTDKNFQKKEDEVCSSPPLKDASYDIDPMLANFIEANFLTQKVERIKYLADLYTRLSHFDVHIQNKPHQHLLYPIGIHLIDKELDEKFS